MMTITSKPNEIDLRKPEGAHNCGGFNLGFMLHPDQVADIDN
jgi:hypothetical protein